MHAAPGVLMPRPSSDHPTKLELQILKILWRRSPMTVREIRNSLAEAGRDLAHTSVITTLGTMVEKGQLGKLEPESGKAFRFEPHLQRHEVSSSMLGELVDQLFDGSAEAVMQSLFDSKEVDEAEIKRLRRMLSQKLKEQE
ncbi:MAG: BlaI/MecI/CopY family transcriptional regulator [Planctomycetota bacterium]